MEINFTCNNYIINISKYGSNYHNRILTNNNPSALTVTNIICNNSLNIDEIFSKLLKTHFA